MSAGMDAMVTELRSLEVGEAVEVIVEVLRDRPELAQPVVAAVCPELTFAPSRIASEKRVVGVIKTFNQKNGYGFIDCPQTRDEFAGDVFVHRRQLGAFAVGQQVTFAILLNEELKPQAFDLQPVGGGPPPMPAQPMPGPMPPMGPGPPPFMHGPPFPGPMPPFPGPGSMHPGGPMMPMGPGGHGHMPPGPGPHGPPPGPHFGAPMGPMPGPRDEPRRHGGPMGDLVGRNFRGALKSFNATSGFGFVDCPELREVFGRDVFVGRDEVNDLEVGVPVAFTLVLNAKGQPQGKAVRQLGSLGGGGRRPGDRAGDRRDDSRERSRPPREGPGPGWPGGREPPPARQPLRDGRLRSRDGRDGPRDHPRDHPRNHPQDVPHDGARDGPRSRGDGRDISRNRDTREDFRDGPDGGRRGGERPRRPPIDRAGGGPGPARELPPPPPAPALSPERSPQPERMASGRPVFAPRKR